MKIEYNFKKFFTKSPIIGAFVYHTDLWQTLAFYTIIILNLINLYSFTDKHKKRMTEPIFYHRLSYEKTKIIYHTFGIALIFFTFWMVLTIISKRVIY